MRTKVKLKEGHTVPQPSTKKPWQYGYVDGYCRAADDLCYAIVVTEHGEFEYVSILSLEACNATRMLAGRAEWV